eukprot:scaffold6867_cov159-Skeletonema_menzelii.AAC.1
MQHLSFDDDASKIPSSTPAILMAQEEKSSINAMMHAIEVRLPEAEKGNGEGEFEFEINDIS